MSLVRLVFGFALLLTAVALECLDVAINLIVETATVLSLLAVWMLSMVRRALDSVADHVETGIVWNEYRKDVD